jgi:hypothetical protein
MDVRRIIKLTGNVKALKENLVSHIYILFSSLESFFNLILQIRVILIFYLFSGSHQMDSAGRLGRR